MRNPNEKYAQSCDALAEAFEAAGRMELSTLCDRAAYWLRGGTGIELNSIQEVVETCRQTLAEALTATEAEDFIRKTTADILVNMRGIQTGVALAASGRQGDIIETAAKVQALAILTQCLFNK